MPDDRELLRRFVERRSDEAFAELVRRHLNLVYFSALRRTNGDTHLARDISQIVFITLAQNAASLQRHAVLAGWLYVTTRHAAAKAMRSEHRRMTRELEALAMQPSSSEPTPDWDRVRPHLESELDTLEEEDRNAILLRFFEGRRFAEIGQALRISDDAARMRVERALDKLRTLLARRGITSTSAALGAVLESQASAPLPAGLAVVVQRAAVTSTVTAGGVAGIFNVMTTSTVTTMIAGVICLLSIGTALHQNRQVRAAQAALHAADDVAQGRIRDLQARLATTEKPLAAAEATSPADTTTAAGPVPSTEPQKRQKKGGPPSSFSQSMEEPTFATAWRQQSIRNLDRTHSDTYGALSLSSEQLGQLKQLLVTRVEAGAYAVEVARAAGLPNVEVYKAVDQATQTANDDIKALIGEAGFTLLERNEKAFRFRPMIESDFGHDLRAAGVPLSADQATNLAVTVSEYWESTWRPQGIGFSGLRQFTDPKEMDSQTGLTPHGAALLDRYARYLTPVQIQVVRDAMTADGRWREITQRR